MIIHVVAKFTACDDGDNLSLRPYFRYRYTCRRSASRRKRAVWPRSAMCLTIGYRSATKGLAGFCMAVGTSGNHFESDRWAKFKIFR
jgi:hypothetical protein